jgi:DNA-binding MarR family transcriptional regulator
MNKHLENLHKVETAMDAMRLAMAGARERLGDGLQLTKTQLEILMMLMKQPQTTSELAKRLFLTQSAVTQTIDTLARRDLIERHADEHDRRITRLTLSAEGRRIAVDIQAQRKTYMEALIQRLTQPEIDALITITQKITAQMNEAKPLKDES